MLCEGPSTARFSSLKRRGFSESSMTMSTDHLLPMCETVLASASQDAEWIFS